MHNVERHFRLPGLPKTADKTGEVDQFVSLEKTLLVTLIGVYKNGHEREELVRIGSWKTHIMGFVPFHSYAS